LLGLVTVVALLLFCQTHIRSLQWGLEYPLMSRPDITQVLFTQAETERRIIQSKVVPHWLMVGGRCLACNATALEQRWDELFVEHRDYVESGYRRHAGAAWLREAEAARDISLAAWGDAARLEAIRNLSDASLPNYLSERRADILRSDRELERSLAKREGERELRSLCVRLAFMLFAVAGLVAYRLGYRYPRRPARSLLPAPEFARGLILFIWAKGFVAVLTRLRWDDPEGPFAIFAALPGLSTTLAITALLISMRPKRADKPIRELVNCPPDRRSRRAVLFLAAASLGVIYAFNSIDWRLLHRLGLVGTEWLPSHLGTPTLLEVFGTVVLVPFGEELLYRGALFGALSRRMSVHRAALISGLFFAAMHGYGFFGFASVALSGYLWARLAARTGSLVPGMVAHGLFNLVFELSRLP